MSMTMDDLRSFNAALASSATVKIVEEEEEDDEVEYLTLDEDDTATALSLLDDAMRMLGFFGDKELSNNIVSVDRKRMLRVAAEIKEFLGIVNSQEE